MKSDFWMVRGKFGGGLQMRKIFSPEGEVSRFVKSGCFFGRGRSFSFYPSPFFGVARDPLVLHSAKFITTVPSNAPMTEEMGFQKLIKSVILIVQTIEDPGETVRS